MNYTFSYYTKDTVPRLLRRPWWNLWGRDTITYEQKWQRYTINGLSQDEADIVIRASSEEWGCALGTLLLRLVGRGRYLCDFQLEVSGEGGEGGAWVEKTVEGPFGNKLTLRRFEQQYFEPRGVNYLRTSNSGVDGVKMK